MRTITKIVVLMLTRNCFFGWRTADALLFIVDGAWGAGQCCDLSVEGGALKQQPTGASLPVERGAWNLCKKM